MGRPLTFEDVTPIAEGQVALEDVAANDGLLILDTDLISTVVYSRHHYGDCPEWVVRAAQARRADLYLFTDIDVPWTADDVRDSGARRAALAWRVCDRTWGGVRSARGVISGDWEERFAAAEADSVIPRGRGGGWARNPPDWIESCSVAGILRPPAAPPLRMTAWNRR